jgi:hypothetical protein
LDRSELELDAEVCVVEAGLAWIAGLAMGAVVSTQSVFKAVASNLSEVIWGRQMETRKGFTVAASRNLYVQHHVDVYNVIFVDFETHNPSRYDTDHIMTPLRVSKGVFVRERDECCGPRISKLVIMARGRPQIVH